MHHGVECGIDTGIQWSFGDLLISSRFEITQFIGLTDKNGNDIYEGDLIVNDEGCLAIVKYRGRMYEAKDHLGWDNLAHIDTCKVIGNIYENSEQVQFLLDKTKTY